MSISALIDEYAAGPAELRNLVAGLSAEQVRARPIPGKWSMLEVVCHLSDFEPVYLDRMKVILTQDKPTFFGRDENSFAAKFAYHQRNLAEELNLIESCRQSMTRILRTLPASDFQRLGIHGEAGEMSLETLLRRVTNHLPHHARFIAEKRAVLQA
ncbi:MAG: DinB family protein [Pirellulaceae bacterium]